MATFEIFNHSIPSIGYISRTSTRGEEYELVNDYINYYVNKKNNLSQKKIAIFIEPQIDTGYPDIVIVEYYISNKILWCEERKSLTKNDLKILFEIQHKGSISVQELKKLLGFNDNELNKSIMRLSKCKMIHANKSLNKIRNAKLKSYCRIKNIIAIEAKINKWHDAIRQATSNTWFAAESYILMKKDKCTDDVLNICKERGIGVILMNGKIVKKLDSQKKAFPISYASLQFNEWILRKLNYKGE